MELQTKTARIPLDDEKIVALYWERDEQAIGETDFKYRKYLFVIVRNLLQDLRDCEECLNDTYIAAWNAMPPERPRLLQAFLTAIMRKTATKCLRGKTRQKRIPADMIDPLSDFEDILTDEGGPQREHYMSELRECINSYLTSIPERRLYVFMARYYFSHPIDHIADTLGVSRGTVNNEITAIKIGLRQKLESEGFII